MVNTVTYGLQEECRGKRSNMYRQHEYGEQILTAQTTIDAA